MPDHPPRNGESQISVSVVAILQQLECLER
jgi:hypothetical protein